MAESVISSQTSYPERPDTSLQAFNNAMGYSPGFGQSSIARWFKSHIGGDPSYNQWRTEQLDRYNADLNAYNSFITSLAGQKAQAEEAGFNPAWLGSDPGGGSSPLQYENEEDPGDNPVGEVLQGVNMFMSLASGAQSLRRQHLQNVLLGQQINAAAWDNVIKSQEAKYAGRYYGYRSFKLGFQSDMAKLLYGNEINSRVAGSPIDGQPYFEETAPGLSNTYYDIGPDARRGLSYQGQYTEVELQKVILQWRRYQSEVAHWTAEEKQYYVREIQPILKEWNEGKKSYQELVNDLYQQQKENEMSNRTANTVVRTILGILGIAARFVPGGNVVSSILTESIDPSTGEVYRSTLQTRK